MFHTFDTSYEPGFIFVSKVLGSVPPRILITRDKQERNEALFNEGLHIAGFFAALPIMSRLFNPLQASFSGIKTGLIRQRNEDAFAAIRSQGERVLRNLKMAKLGKSLGVLVFLSFIKLAIPYMRNLRTVMVTGYTDYTQVIALDQKNGPRVPPDPQKAAEAKQKNLRMIGAFLAGGLTASAGVMGAAALLARKGKAIFEVKGFLNPQRLEKLVRNLALVGKNSDQVMAITKSPHQSNWFWALPFYLGTFIGCRDTTEVWESVTKLLTFIAGYNGMPKLINQIMSRTDRSLLAQIPRDAEKNLPGYDAVLTQNAIPDAALKARYLKYINTKQGVSLLGTLLVTGALPLVFNIYFTNWRNQRKLSQQQALQTRPFASYPTPPFRAF